MSRSVPTVVALTLALGLAACGGRPAAEAEDTTPKPKAPKGVVGEARVSFPRVIDMHQKIVGRSCAPNAGVCHNTSNYPDMQTTGSLLSLVGAWCNIAIPDPTAGFDMCERPGDFFVLADQMVSEIAWAERVSLDFWRFGLRDPAPVTGTFSGVYFYEDSTYQSPVLLSAEDWLVAADLEAGSDVVTVHIDGLADNPFVQDFVDTALLSIIPGDPNQNGLFGADENTGDERATVLQPGSLTRSYLWGRITGTVPGSRMPLANQPLSDPEYVAIACFIEGLAANPTPSPDDAIDYDACEFAKEPISFAVE